VGTADVVELSVSVTGTVAGTHTATAGVTSATPDPDPENNTASSDIEVTAAPLSADVAIAVVATPATVEAGGVSQLTATVTNAGPDAATDAIVTFTLPPGLTPPVELDGTGPSGCEQGPPITCPVGTVGTADVVELSVSVTGTVAGTHTATAGVTSATPDPDPKNNTASVTLQVEPVADLAVTIEVDPVPGYVGGEQTVTLTMTNAGPLPATATVTVELPEGSGPPEGEPCVTAAGCAVAELAPEDEVTRSFTLTPEVALTGRATATITGPLTDPEPANNSDRTRIRVLQPTMAFSPPLGEPGRVSMLVGIDFPPRGRVGLKWDEGLLNFRVPIRVRADGSFQVPILALRRDRLGPRTMTAARVSGAQFGVVSADYLVVPRTQFPPDFNGRG
jgi:uncharacterized repeat protein (TIGR01451 family)